MSNVSPQGKVCSFFVLKERIIRDWKKKLATSSHHLLTFLSIW
jgi:hypothetical protein